MPASVEPRVRVLHLRDSPWVDGPGRTILETGAHLDPARVAYHIGALVGDASTSHAFVDSARQRGLDVLSFRDDSRWPQRVVDDVVGAIDRYRINVLHSSELRSRLIARLCRRRRRIALVTTAHGWIANSLGRRMARVVDKCLLRGFDRVILVSEAMRRLVPGWWLPDQRVEVLHNALVTNAYGSEVLGLPRRPIDPASGATLLNVGRFSPEKGQDLLLRAVHALRERWPAVRVRFAGAGPLEGRLRALAAELGLGKRVEFIGFVRDMPPVYHEADLLVQSSSTEGMPNVILEAAFLRVPIVATDVGGTSEVVRHRESAWLVEPTLQSLTEGIESFLRDPSMFVTMSERAHERILRDFTFDARTERLARLYESLIEAGA